MKGSDGGTAEAACATRPRAACCTVEVGRARASKSARTVEGVDQQAPPLLGGVGGVKDGDLAGAWWWGDARRRASVRACAGASGDSTARSGIQNTSCGPQAVKDRRGEPGKAPLTRQPRHHVQERRVERAVARHQACLRGGERAGVGRRWKMAAQVPAGSYALNQATAKSRLGANKAPHAPNAVRFARRRPHTRLTWFFASKKLASCRSSSPFCLRR